MCVCGVPTGGGGGGGGGTSMPARLGAVCEYMCVYAHVSVGLGRSNQCVALPPARLGLCVCGMGEEQPVCDVHACVGWARSNSVWHYRLRLCMCV